MSEAEPLERLRLSVPSAEAEAVTAAREAEEAQQLVATLEARVVDGDDMVTAQEIEQARSLGRFARLRATAAQRCAERARVAARLERLEVVAERMRDHGGGADAARYLELLATIEDAAAALLEFTVERDVLIGSWRAVMHREGVPVRSGSHPLPVAEHGRVGWSNTSGHAVFVDDRAITPINPAELLAAAVQRAARRTGTLLERNGAPLTGQASSWADNLARNVERSCGHASS
jgi:hypothetical protein